MKILVRNHERNSEWTVAGSLIVAVEAELQTLLAETPSLIPVDDIRDGFSPLVAAVRECGLPGSGNTDLLSFSAAGEITIVECKLAANADSKRKVIGQILEYAAHLWQMTYDELDNRVQKIEGKPLARLIEEAVSADWDEEAFRNGIKQSLETGSFALIVVVDRMNEELRRIIRYVNACGGQSAFSLHALEIERFAEQGVEILVPRLHGESVKAPPPPPVQWPKERFFDTLQASVDADTYRIAEKLYHWSLAKGDTVEFGTGKVTGSYTFYYLRDGSTMSVFSVFTDGSSELKYGQLTGQIDETLIGEFHGKIQEIPGISRIPAEFSGKYPRFKIAEAFKKPEDLQTFEQAVLWLGKQIVAST